MTIVDEAGIELSQSTTSLGAPHIGPSENSHILQDDKQPLVAHKYEYRRKQLHTLYICLSFLSLGMLVALKGPTFLDLLLLLNVDIALGTIMFTSESIGYLFGCVIGGVVYEKFNEALSLFFFTVGAGLSTVMIPWCKYLWLMAMVRAIQGAAVGAIDTGVNALLMKTWGDGVAVYMQTLHFLFSVGGIISPLVAEPFLATTAQNQSSTIKQKNSPANDSGSDYFGTGKSSGLLDREQKTEVHIPYLILGLITVATALPYLEMYSRCRNWENETINRRRAGDDASAEYTPLPKSLKFVFLTFIGMFYFSYSAVEYPFPSFIMAFVVEHLKWSKSKGTLITSMFWVSLSAGRLLGIGLAKFLTPWKMLVVDFVLLNLAFLAFYLGVESSEAFAWVCTVIIAMSLASMFAAGYTWTEQRIMKVTAKVISFIVTFAAIGAMVNPILIGYLFETYTPMWFVYLLYIDQLLCTIVFVSISMLVFWWHRKKRDR